MKNSKVVIARILEDLTLLSHSVLSTFINEDHLLKYKPIHLCEWYGRLGLDTPKYFIGKTVVPTLTTSACTSVLYTSATGNGNITATGGANPTIRGFCYMVGTSGDPTTSNSTKSESGSFGTGSYSLSITGLVYNTGYRVRAYATNSAGTGYGTTVQLTTINVPSIVLGTPTEGSTEDTTPVLYFTGTALSGEEIEYEVQIDTVDTFNSQTAINRYLKYLNVSTYKYNSPTGYLYAIVRSGSNSGTIVGTSENRLMSEFITTPGQFEIFTFTTPIELSIGTNYFIQLLRTANYDATNRCDINLSNGNYASGDCYEYNTSWTVYTGVDIIFQLLDSDFTVFLDCNYSKAGSEPLCGEPSGTYARVGQSFAAPSVAASLKDKFSAKPDTGFYHDGSDTHPFTSGHEITFTIQVGDELPSNDTYYWRVRARDATYGLWGSWSSAKSFVVPAVLVVANTSHLQSSDNVTLTPHTGGTELVVQNSSHAHTSESPTLVYVAILVVNNASHAHAAGNITLTLIITASAITADGHNFYNDTTPTLEFVGFDPGARSLEYEVKINQKWEINTPYATSYGWAFNSTSGGHIFTHVSAGTRRLWHFNGSSWVEERPINDASYYWGPLDIANGKMLAMRWIDTTNYYCQLYYYDGSSWSRVYPSGTTGDTLHYYYPRLSEDGSQIIVSEYVGGGKRIYRYNGSTWSEEQPIDNNVYDWTTVNISTTVSGLRMVAAEGSSDVIYKYNGSSWSSTSPAGGVSKRWDDIYISGNKIFIFGIEHFSGYGRLWYFNESSWSEQRPSGIDHTRTWNITMSNTKLVASNTIDGTYYYDYGDAVWTETEVVAGQSYGVNTIDADGDSVVAHYDTDIYYNGGYSLDKHSETDSGFANITTPSDTHPFNSGDTIDFTVQSAEIMIPGTYYWIVQAAYDSETSEWTAERYFIVTGSPGVDADDTAHVQTAENITLIQHYILTNLNSSHILTSDNITLSATSPQIYADTAIHTLTSDNITLTVSLCVLDSSHAHTSENLTILAYEPGVTVIYVDNSQLLQYSDVVNLTQQNILVVGSTLHTLYSDTIRIGGKKNRVMMIISNT